jgi:hypothetical protein
MVTDAPWTSGPREVLEHGLDLLATGTDASRRLALISIDNAVELMVRTYLSLPKRVSKLSISRKDFEELASSFPNLLDGLERHCPAKLDGVNLGVIEWYHRLRNDLYHQAGSLSISQDKVEIYSELAKALFRNLFGVEPTNRTTFRTQLLGEFISEWVRLENGLRETADTHSATGFRPKPIKEVLQYLKHGSIVPESYIAEINELMKIRNEVLHGVRDYASLLTPEVVQRVRHLADQVDDSE